MPGVDDTGPSAGGDELDDLFNYDIDVDAAFRDLEDQKNITGKQAQEGPGKPSADLGIDEEVQVKTARKPVPKLDESRLLSERGIPKLRNLTRQKLKYRGKGYEFKDMARMMSLYQLWMDDLYPRAKFLDSLAMVEKLGHLKSMHRRRKDWIEESKPQSSFEASKSQTDVPQNDAQNLSTAEPSPPSAARYHPNTTATLDIDSVNPDSLFLSDEEREPGVPDEDELDALLSEEAVPLKRNVVRSLMPLSQDSVRTSPVREDDLDDLWAEHEAIIGKENRSPQNLKKLLQAPTSRLEDFEDEMEVMAELDLW